MRLVGDISAFQTHKWDWSAWQDIDLAAYAGAVDACWVRWTDWKGYVQWGADPGYRETIDRLRDHIPVAAYLYPRPGWTNPAEQVAQWHAATPPITFDPMLDPEANEGLPGPVFSAWIDAALAEMTQRFQRVPWLYAQASKVRAFGWTRPTTPHRLLLAEYHQDEQVFEWANRNGWEPHTYSEGPPEQPAGWVQHEAWQFTQRAQYPGMESLADGTWMTDEAFAASSSGAPDDGFTPTDRQTLHDLRRIFGGTP